MSNCPWCNAPRDTAPKCPNCGAIYTKAEAIKTYGRAPLASLHDEAPGNVSEQSLLPIEPLITSSPQKISLVEDSVLEWQLCMGAIPISLCFALAFHVFTPFLQRTFLGMPIHELGHAVTAWFCGFVAMPTLWVTHVSETRGFIAPIALLGGLGYLIHAAYRSESKGLVALGGLLVLILAIGRFGIKENTAEMLIVFGGDGAGMVLATVLMSTFFFGKETQLYKGLLRWGFLVIGAAAFVDMFSTWWVARSDFGKLPFGEQEGGLRSDALRLVEDYGWDSVALSRCYVTLGICCLIVLALVYTWGVWQAKRAVNLVK
jgi:hypothetical protein